MEKNKVKLEQKIGKILAVMESHIQSDTQEANEECLPKQFDSKARQEKLAVLNKKLKEPTHLESPEQAYQQQSTEVVADTGC
ncbi:MAG TPA: hypothetical protein DCM08_13720 [Microscillaceae bacterium]|nr:hypothetical protein [Microscillaceae bacterium]